MMPGVSAGSNQVGASDICTPHVNWLCGAAAPASRGRLAAATPSAAPAIAPRRLMRAPRGKSRGSPQMDEAMVLLLAAPLMEPCAEFRSPRSRRQLSLVNRLAFSRRAQTRAEGVSGADCLLTRADEIIEQPGRLCVEAWQ